MHRQSFEVVFHKVIDEFLDGSHGESLCEAVVKIRVNGDEKYVVAEGNGPVNALDQALRKALYPSFPFLENVRLAHWKAMIAESNNSASKVKVAITFLDKNDTWVVQKTSTNSTRASFYAIVEGLQMAISKTRSLQEVQS